MVNGSATTEIPDPCDRLPPMSYPGAPTHDPNDAAALRPLTILVSAMAGGLVMLAVVLALLGAQLETPETWMLLVVGVTTIGAWALALGSPVPKVAQSMPLAAQVRPLVVLRAAVLEAPAIIGLVLAFMSQPINLLVYVLPALFSVAGLLLFARPSVVAQRVSRGA